MEKRTRYLITGYQYGRLRFDTYLSSEPKARDALWNYELLHPDMEVLTFEEAKPLLTSLNSNEEVDK